MPSNTLSLLGSPRIMSFDGTRDIPPDQSLWLLCYVCVQDGWVSRESLKSLLWPEANESDASNNLRVLLHRAKRGILAGLLEVEPSRVRVTAYGFTPVRARKILHASRQMPAVADQWVWPTDRPWKNSVPRHCRLGLSGTTAPSR